MEVDVVVIDSGAGAEGQDTAGVRENVVTVAMAFSDDKRGMERHPVE